MTTAATIAALEALTAEALKSADDAQLARLEELGSELAKLIDDERERRRPTASDEEENEFERLMQISEEHTERRMAAYRARRATIKEAVEYCASKPELHERMKAIFWA